MADLAGDAAEAPVRSAAEDEPGADAGGDAHVDQVVDAAGRAEHLLAQGADVGVVLELDGDAEARLHLGRRADAVPAGEDALGGDLARRPVDRRREAHADAQEPVGGDARATQARAHELVGEVEALDRGVVDLGGRPVVGDELAGEIADRHADVLVAEVEPDREAGAGDEREQHRRAPGGPRAVAIPASRSSTTPAWPSSSTSAETVARERPVQRARSVRLDPGWR